MTFSRKSTVYFSENRASLSGAILATESRVLMYGETTIANNVASNSGGGISLKKSRLEINGVCQVVNNSAVRGGGIHASTSDIAVTKVATLLFISNNANFGGGSYLEKGSKLYTLNNSVDIVGYLMVFMSNYAIYGGAV